jgi:RNA recognition motif-containing protein
MTLNRGLASNNWRRRDETDEPTERQNPLAQEASNDFSPERHPYRRVVSRYEMQPDRPHAPPHRLYVGNLSCKVKAVDVKAMFEDAGLFV